LCDSILKVTAQPSPTSITPAFSPGPTSSTPDALAGDFSANWRRCTFEDLYEQCSLHMTE